MASSLAKIEFGNEVSTLDLCEGGSHYMDAWYIMLMLIPMTLTFMQGHSGSGDGKQFSVESVRHLSKQ